MPTYLALATGFCLGASVVMLLWMRDLHKRTRATRLEANRIAAVNAAIEAFASEPQP